MRAILNDGRLEIPLLLQAAGLNVVYLAVGISFFMYMFHLARRDGQLLTIGE